MIAWKPVNNRNDMPFKGQFLALWKGAICLAEYDEELNQFWIIFFPAQNSVMLVAHEREKKFTHWAPIEYPVDY